MATKNQTILGLDIGTFNIKAVIADIVGEGDDSSLKVIGVGCAPAKGLKGGIVVNIDSVVNSIASAVQSAELMAGKKVNSAYVVISGEHIRGLDSTGRVTVGSKEVSEKDIFHVIEDAKKTKLPEDYVVWHVLPQEFILDGQSGINDPLGMSGVKLEVKVHLVMASTGNSQNIIKCVQKCGLKVKSVSLAPITSAQSVLSNEEKNLGVCLLDIGAGTTDIAVFKGGVVRYVSVLPLGGDYLTLDIASVLRTPVASSEGIKCQHGSCVLTSSEEKGKISIPSIGGRPPQETDKKMLRDIISCRVEEIVDGVVAKMSEAGYKDVNSLKALAGGFVVTGGTANLRTLDDFIAKKLDVAVRIGKVSGVTGLEEMVSKPEYAAVIGLVQREALNSSQNYMNQSRGLLTLLSKIGSWFSHYF